MQDEFFKAIQPHANTGGAIPHAGGYPGANTVKFEILRDKISILVFALTSCSKGPGEGGNASIVGKVSKDYRIVLTNAEAHGRCHQNEPAARSSGTSVVPVGAPSGVQTRLRASAQPIAVVPVWPRLSG